MPKVKTVSVFMAYARAAKSCHSGVDGREMLFALLGPGTWFGEISMFDDLPRTHDNFCETNCTVAIIQKNAFKALLEQYPELYPHFTRLYTRVRSAFQFIDSSAGLALSTSW